MDTTSKIIIFICCMMIIFIIAGCTANAVQEVKFEADNKIQYEAVIHGTSYFERKRAFEKILEQHPNDVIMQKIIFNSQDQHIIDTAKVSLGLITAKEKLDEQRNQGFVNGVAGGVVAGTLMRR